MTALEQTYIAAGTRYAAAFAELRAAMVDLAALDRIVGSANGGHVPGFGDLPEVIKFRHARFAPEIGGHLPDDIATRLAAIAAGR